MPLADDEALRNQPESICIDGALKRVNPLATPPDSVQSCRAADPCLKRRLRSNDLQPPDTVVAMASPGEKVPKATAQ